MAISAEPSESNLLSVLNESDIWEFFQISKRIQIFFLKKWGSGRIFGDFFRCYRTHVTFCFSDIVLPRHVTMSFTVTGKQSTVSAQRQQSEDEFQRQHQMEIFSTN